MTRARGFSQIDVFGQAPMLGNPLAVVLDASDLSDDQMRNFARWTNLSETTFLLPPTSVDADYRVRIFTPATELPFAGHPTLGSCHAWLEAGGKPASSEFIVQQCGIGLVRLRRHPPRLAFAAPALRQEAIEPGLLAQVCAALGVQAQHVRATCLLDNGPKWLSLLLADPQTVLALQPDHARLKDLGYKVGVAAPYPASAGARGPHLEVRAFAAPAGVPEDPVTGSLNASLAQWLIASGQMPSRYIASQGACLDRAGRVHIEEDPMGQVWVGGEAVTCIRGSVTL